MDGNNLRKTSYATEHIISLIIKRKKFWIKVGKIHINDFWFDFTYSILYYVIWITRKTLLQPCLWNLIGGLAVVGIFRESSS